MKYLTIRLNDKCRVDSRCDNYEDPIRNYLAEKGIGILDGGGTQFNGDTGEVEFCDVNIGIHDDSETVINELIDVINELGAPKGSLLMFDDKNIPVGELSGVGVYFRYYDVPDDIYDSVDINEFWEGVADAVEPLGFVHDVWEGPDLAAYYFYGKDEKGIIKAVTEHLEGHPWNPYIEPKVLKASLD